MNKELLQEARTLWEKDEKIAKFGSKFEVYPTQEVEQVYQGLNRLAEQIPNHPSAQSTETLHEAELKRMLATRIMTLEHFLHGTPYTLDDVIKMYGIESNDLADVKLWLLANRTKTQDAIVRLFSSTNVASFQLALPYDIPRIRRQAEGLAETEIENYHETLGNLFTELTSAGNYVHAIKPVPSTVDRSYFNPHTRTLAISIPAICYVVERGSVRLKERELLRLFGHEGMGHGLHQVITNASDVPFFLKKSSASTTATEESITQHYERVIFEDVKQSKKTQRELRIADNFDEIYQEELDTRQITDFNRNLFYYGILVLADKPLGNPQDPDVIRKKMELISEVALNPGAARGFVEQHKYKYDVDGNLDDNLVSELRYSSQAVKRALEVLQGHGIHYDNKDDRSYIDMTFLTGYFTPVGFVQKAELAAKGKVK